MPSATLNSKGQVTLPKQLRDTLGLTTGDSLYFHLREDGVVEMSPEKGDLLSLSGMIKPRVRGVSLENMEKTIRSRGSGSSQ